MWNQNPFIVCGEVHNKMDEKRREFIGGLAAVAGALALDGLGFFRAAAKARSAAKGNGIRLSTDINDYPHIIDAIPSKDMKRYFGTIVKACADPKHDYLSKIPFLIELEVCKIWSESRFEWDALSNAGAAGLQQLMPQTAKEFGLPIAKSREIIRLDSAISDYMKLRQEISSKREDLFALVEDGSMALSRTAVSKLNGLRAALGALYTKRAAAYEKLKKQKAAYVAKINSLSVAQRKKVDARFVPDLLIPAGVDHLVKDILACKDFFGGTIEMNVWRGIAAYNAGLSTTKKWEGMPFIQETVYYTRGILLNLTRALELKHAYSTKNKSLIAETRRRMRVGKKRPYSIYVVQQGDCFYEIVREQLMDPYKLSYSNALKHIRDGKGGRIDIKKMSTIMPNQVFRIYAPE